MAVQQVDDLVDMVCSQSGEFYCSEMLAHDSFEIGTAKSVADLSPSIDEINMINFGDDLFSMPMREYFSFYSVDIRPACATGM